MPIARVNGIDIYYEDEGEGSPVLFIHGGFGGAESALYPKPSSFKGVLPLDRYRTVVFERRGCGRSEFVDRPYALRDIAADARELLRHLGIERALVVGDSLGGMVAQRLALDYPEVVESLLLCETGSFIFRPPATARAILLAARRLPVRRFFPLLRKRLLEPEFYEPLGPLSAEEIDDRRHQHEEYRARLRTLPEDELYRLSMGLLRNYAAFGGADLRAEVPRMSMPVEIMHGTEDRVVRFETGASMLQLMPHAGFHELLGLGHGLFYYPEGREMARGLIEAMTVQQSLHPAATG